MKCKTCKNCQIIHYQEYPGASQSKEEICAANEDGGENCPSFVDISAQMEKEEAEKMALLRKCERRDNEFYFDLTGQDEDAFYDNA